MRETWVEYMKSIDCAKKLMSVVIHVLSRDLRNLKRVD